MLVFLFWLFAFGAIFSYFIYPLVLKILVRIRPEPTAATDAETAEPIHFSLIVTAYNEAGRIREKIENTLKITFDRERLELIVASDCSEDETDAIVREYADRGVRLVRAAERLGKENAQKTAIDEARGNVIVFSDVATQIPEDALERLAVYFTDAQIGAVSSEDRFVSRDGSVAGEGAYVKYEMWLRQQESALAGLVGLSGSFFAARKSVCEIWDIHSPSDFNTALNTARLGLRAVTAPDVLGYYEDLKDPQKEYQRKIRTVIRGMTALARHKEVLNPSKFGLFAFQVFAHKLMRWLVPWFLVGLFIVTALIAHRSGFYVFAFLLQLAFYGIFIASHFSAKLRQQPAIKLIYFFVQVNIALMDAAIKFLTGARMTTWKPSAR